MFIHKECKHKRRNIYTACEDLDFTWDLGDVRHVGDLWRSGLSVEGIAEEIGRPYAEVVILIIDRSGQGLITERPNGFAGWRELKIEEVNT